MSANTATRRRPDKTPSWVPQSDPYLRERVKRRRDGRAGWTLLAPAAIILAVMVGYPAVLMVIQSFTDYEVRDKVQGTLPDFVGFDNYIEIFTESDFPAVLMRSLGIMVVLTVLSMGLGMLVAVLLTKLTRGWRILVSVGLLLAWAMPPLSATVVWGWIFDTEYGLVNYLLNTITGTSDWTNHSWLIDPLLVLLRAHDPHRVAERAVRGLHDLCRPRSGSR